MKLQNLFVENFRNFSKLDLTFSAEANILVGDNAQGKTNCLEVIYFLAYSKSYRTSNLPNIIRQGSQVSQIAGIVEGNGITNELVILIEDNVKKLYVDKKLVDLKNYLGKLKIILYEPFTLMISGIPNQRRRYLDRMIVSLDQNYLIGLANYNRVVQHRNLLLKRSYSSKEKEAWDEQFIKYAIAIWQARFEYIKKICSEVAKLKEIFFNETDGIEIGLKTYPQLPIEQNMWADEVRKTFELIKDKEKQFGFTMLGPHRDDLIISMNGMDMKAFGSSGQLKAILLLMTLAQMNMFYDVFGEFPVLIFDDVDTELDKRKIKSFLSSLKPGTQIFLSTTNREVNKFLPAAALYNVSKGIITKQ